MEKHFKIGDQLSTKHGIGTITGMRIFQNSKCLPIECWVVDIPYDKGIPVRVFIQKGSEK